MTQLIIHRRKSRPAKAPKKDSAKTNKIWTKLWSFITGSTRWAWIVLSGKGKSHSLWLSKSLYLAAFIYVSFFIMVPVILATIAFFSIILMPPPIIGIKMAQDELVGFSCPHDQNELTINSKCSVIMLKDGKSFVGIIYSKDSRFMYLLTKDEAKTIAKLVSLNGFMLTQVSKLWSHFIATKSPHLLIVRFYLSSSNTNPNL